LAGNAIEHHPDGQAVVAQHLDPVADLENDPAVHREHARADPLLVAAARMDPNQRHGLSHRGFHERLGREQIEIEILLDDADVVGDDAHRLGTDLRGDVRKLLADPAGGKGDLPPVLNQSDIVVVDGDRDSPCDVWPGCAICGAWTSADAGAAAAAAARQMIARIFCFP
jgi:hypothetical protein